MTALRFTAIIPTFNRPTETDAAIRSVLAQGHAALAEILVVDDASATPYRFGDARVGDVPLRIVRHPLNRGAAAARNTAIALAETPWLAFLDSDDIWLPGKIDAQLAQLARHPEAASIAITCGFRKSRGGEAGQDFWPVASGLPADFASGCWFCPGSTILVARDAFTRVGPFDERLPRFEDNDWYLRFALAGGRLERADVIGSLIRIGHHPSPQQVAESARIFKDIWRDRPEAAALEVDIARYHRAWLALEQAAAIYREEGTPFLTRMLRMLPHLGQSWLDKPRYQVHLRQFWEEAPQAEKAVNARLT